ncbi:GFA family protein [Dyella koreensis]
MVTCSLLKFPHRLLVDPGRPVSTWSKNILWTCRTGCDSGDHRCHPVARGAHAMLPQPCFQSSCACGGVLLETRGRPIAAVACHCSDCQAAARQIEGLPGAPPILDACGGTAFLVLRKDRMRPVRGGELLRGLKLSSTSPTTRYVAACCNAMMYLGFDDAKHWVSMNRARFDGEVPAVRMRVCTGSMPDGAVPADLPCYRGYPMSLMGGLVLAGFARWIGR